MKLEVSDTIEIGGIHPTNPITGKVIHEFLQSFIVTHAMDGDMIDPGSVHPRFMFGDEPIPMSRIVRHNFRHV